MKEKAKNPWNKGEGKKRNINSSFTRKEKKEGGKKSRFAHSVD